ncbi:Uncharacterised protein [Streptococcus pneumoniae]|nr:Uncharacterised protein [Streptococcus pneumoniae]CJA35838.1 Uncharacterised protein [Streptococcus pneumoniae]
MRFPIKFGVSFAITTPFPRTSSPNSFMKLNTCGSVSFVGITSRSFKYRGGLKKCVPKKCFWKSSERPSAIFSTEIPDVFELTIEPGLRTASTFSNSFFLISKFSTTTSIIQSTSARRSRSSSKLPASISAKFPFTVRGAGFCFNSFCTAVLLKRFLTLLCSNVSPFASSSFVSAGGTISSNNVGIPILAKCAAIPEPITPEPRTAAFLIWNIQFSPYS